MNWKDPLGLKRRDQEIRELERRVIEHQESLKECRQVIWDQKTELENVASLKDVLKRWLADSLQAEGRTRTPPR